MYFLFLTFIDTTTFDANFIQSGRNFYVIYCKECFLVIESKYHGCNTYDCCYLLCQMMFAVTEERERKNKIKIDDEGSRIWKRTFRIIFTCSVHLHERHYRWPTVCHSITDQNTSIFHVYLIIHLRLLWPQIEKSQ